MKKQIKIFLVILALFDIFVFSMILPNVVLETSLPEVSDTYPALIVKTPEVTPEYVEEIGKRFGFTGEAGSAEAGIYYMSDETRFLKVYEDSGAISYSIPSKMSRVSPSNVPSEDAAKIIAEEYLSEMGLLPAYAKLDGVSADKQSTIVKSTGNVLEEYNVMVKVYSTSREINGAQVVGPGNQLEVQIGSNGEVVSLFKAWSDLEPYKYVRIKTPEAAYNDLLAGNVIGTTLPLDQVDRVYINNVYLAYYMDSADNPQEYTMPVYVFQGTDFQGDYFGRMGFAFSGYVNATLPDTPEYDNNWNQYNKIKDSFIWEKLGVVIALNASIIGMVLAIMEIRKIIQKPSFIVRLLVATVSAPLISGVILFFGFVYLIRGMDSRSIEFYYMLVFAIPSIGIPFFSIIRVLINTEK